MTGRTVIGNTRMVEIRSCERRGVVAYRTILVGTNRHMSNRHPDRMSIVVAGRTFIDNALVAEYGRPETTTRGVTNTAIRRRWHVIDLGILAGGIGAIVAGITTHTLHLWAIVVEESTDEGLGVMAHGAIAGSVNVIGNFILAGNTGKGTVMAGITTHAQHIRSAMVNILRYPGSSVMAH